MRSWPWSTVESLLLLLVRGCPTLESSRRTGVPRSAVARWGKRVGMEDDQGSHGDARTVELFEVVTENASRKYRRLTLGDRAFIQAARSLAAPLSMRGIAPELELLPPPYRESSPRLVCVTGTTAGILPRSRDTRLLPCARARVNLSILSSTPEWWQS